MLQNKQKFVEDKMYALAVIFHGHAFYRKVEPRLKMVPWLVCHREECPCWDKIIREQFKGLIITEQAQYLLHNKLSCIILFVNKGQMGTNVLKGTKQVKKGPNGAKRGQKGLKGAKGGQQGPNRAK